MAVSLAFLLLAFCLLGPPGCIDIDRDNQQRLNIMAAASTTDALDNALELFYSTLTSQRHYGSYGASSMLANQIINGAPADLYLSASSDWADAVAEQVPVLERTVIVSNRIVVVGPSEALLPGGAQEDINVLLSPAFRRIAIADPEAVPAGIYARETLILHGLWTPLRAKIVPTQDVRAAARLAAIGEVDAALVYASDAYNNPALRPLATILPELQPTIRYELLLLRETHPHARLLFNFLNSPNAYQVFQAFGFLPLTQLESGAAGTDTLPSEMR